MQNRQIYIFHATDYQKYPIGGTIGTIKNFLFYTQFECILIGLTNDSGVRIGKWQKISVRGKQFDYLPVGYSKKEVVPHKIIMLIGTFLFKNRILKKCLGNQFNAMFYVDRQCHTAMKYLLPKTMQLNSFYKMTDATNPLVTSGRKLSKYKPLQTLYFDLFFKPLLIDSKLIFSINDECRNFCETTLTTPESRKKIHHLNHFVDFDGLTSIYRNISKKTRPEQITNFVFWGRIVEVKGLTLMIDAIKVLNDQKFDCTLRIIGDGEDREKHEKYTRNLHLEDIIHFPGKMDIKEIAEFSAEADLFLMSSFSEGIPTAMLEAMVFGLPVVSTAVGGIHTLIENGVNGFLIANRNAASYAEGIRNALKLDRREVRRFNTERVRKEFSASAIVYQMDKLISESIS